MENPVIINVLIALLGLAGGVGIAHFGILKRVNRNSSKNVAQEEKIKTLFRETEENKKSFHECLSLHSQSLAQNTKIIDQNNLLIQKILVK